MTTLAENVAAAIATNTALSAWCVGKYEQAQTVYLGINFDQLPDIEEYPIAMVAEVASLEGKAVPVESATIVVTCGIADDSIPVTSGNLKKYKQVADLDAFRKLVLAAVEAADLLGGHVSEVEMENDPVELFPIFSTNMIVKIQHPSPMRGRWSK